MSTLNTSTERRYQKTKSPYFMPQDVIEQNRLHAQAAAIVEMIGSAPFIAHVQHRWDVSKAVDVGCGTGVATIQIAAIFPTAKVYGLDLSPVPQAVQSMASSNVAWAEGNVLDAAFDRPGDDTMSREIFVPDNLDYIFGRMLFLGIDNWSSYFSTTYRSLKSSGMIEHQDWDWAFYRVGTDECLSDQWEWHQAILASATHLGISRSEGSGAEVAMKAAGFDVLSGAAI
ncbi:MAG: hypothetical protein Q9203_004396 [Teloschistes exilis]